MKTISFWRRLVQGVFLVLIVYGGALVFHGEKIKLPAFFTVASTPAEFKQMTATKIAPPQSQPLNLYMPFKSCRYARGAGVFRACFAHFLQETFSWRDPLRMWLPYLAFFAGLAILLGRFTCGWICPMGFFQEMLAGLRRLLKIREVTLDEAGRAKLRAVGLLVLFAILCLSWVVAIKTLPWPVRDGIYLAGCQTCPGRIIYSVMTGLPLLKGLDHPVPIALFGVGVLFFIFFLAGFWINRIWCSFCPNGIFLSFFNRGKLITQEKKLLHCARCSVCANACVMGSNHVYREKKSPYVDHPDCVGCLRCLERCPQKALKVTLFGKKLL